MPQVYDAHIADPNQNEGYGQKNFYQATEKK